MANRSMAPKVDRAKSQAIAAVQAESTKACYMTSKPTVPAYDLSMVKRVEVKTKARKTVYRAAPARKLVQVGIAACSGYSEASRFALIKRAR